MDIFENMSLIAITGSSRTMFKCLITTFQKRADRGPQNRQQGEDK